MTHDGTAILDEREGAGVHPRMDAPSQVIIPSGSPASRLLDLIDEYLVTLHTEPKENIVHLLVGSQVQAIGAVVPTLADWLRTLKRFVGYPPSPTTVEDVWDMTTEGLAVVRTRVARNYRSEGPTSLNSFTTRAFLAGVQAHWRASAHPEVHADALPWILRFLPDLWQNPDLSNHQLAERLRHFDAAQIARRLTQKAGPVTVKNRAVKRLVRRRAAWRWQMLKAIVATFRPIDLPTIAAIDRQLLAVVARELTAEERAAVLIRLGVNLGVSELTEARVRQDYSDEQVGQLIEDACDRIQDLTIGRPEPATRRFVKTTISPN